MAAGAADLEGVTMPRDRRLPVTREAVSVQHAAVLLDVHEDTVYRLIKAHKLLAFRVGRAIRILRSDLLAYRRAQAN
jgi:excisionase family DNA binding protein